jgi:glycosyltransferase involved in cell wall biosynthesis
MRVLHLTEFYVGVGGLERGLHMICDALEAAGHVSSVAFGVLRGGELQSPRAVYHIPGLVGPVTTDTLNDLREVLKKEQPDVLIIHELLDPDILDWATAQRPSIRFVWGFKLICPGGRRMWQGPGQVCPRPVGYMCQAVAYRERCMPRDPRMGVPLIARTLKVADIHRERSAIVVPSEFMRGLLLKEGFIASRVHKVPLFTILPSAEMLQPSREPHMIFCAARLTPEKGVHLLLEAIKDLPEVRLIVAGAGPECVRLEAMVDEYSLQGRVTFTGWLDPTAVASYIDRAGIVVVPSAWPEPFGLVGIEAMAHARPVVAFDVGGIREWLSHDKTGLLVPPADGDALHASLLRLLNEPDWASQLGRNGRAVAEERFTASIYLKALLPVLSSAVTGGAVART